MRKICGPLVALAIGFVGLSALAQSFGISPSTPAMAAPATGRPAADWLVQAWKAYKARFVQGGRIHDDVNGYSHSEGQGYAMLIAAKADDREGFDQIWSWTKRELSRADGLFSWKWEENASPHVTDRNNATDGDILIAWALAESGARWGVDDYTEAATAISNAIRENLIERTKVGKVLMPAEYGFDAATQSDGPVVNLSYWVFPAFERLYRLNGGRDWTTITTSGLRLVRESRFGPLSLPTEWIALGSGKPAPAKNFPAVFGYNAVRVPLYLAWSDVSKASDLTPFRSLLKDGGPTEVDAISGRSLSPFGGSGFKALSALVACALDKRKLGPADRSIPIEHYYPTTLHILSLIAMHERFPECL